MMNLFQEYEYFLEEKNSELIFEFDKSYFIASAKSSIGNKIEEVKMNFDINANSSILLRSIQDLNQISLNKESFSKEDTFEYIDGRNITMYEIENPMITFKLNYLKQYLETVQKLINQIINDKINEDGVTKYLNDGLTVKVEKQTVHTTLPYGMNIKTLIMNSKAKEINVTSEYIHSVVIPFVNKYDSIKGQIISEATSVLNAIKDTEATVTGIIQTINSAIKNPELNITYEKNRLLQQVTYNTMRSIIEISSFVTFNTVHKMNKLSQNTITVNKLGIDLFNIKSALPNENVIEEALGETIFPDDSHSVADDLCKGEAHIFDDIANKIYDFHMSQDRIASIMSQVDPDETSYNRQIYDETSKMYIIIKAGLDIISSKVDDVLLVFDELVNEAGFAVDLTLRFSEVLKKIEDITEYRSSDNVSYGDNINYDMYRKMLLEIKDYPVNMKNIANIIKETKDETTLLQERIKENINGELTDLESINELDIFLNEFQDQLTVLSMEVGERYLNRLKNIGILLTNMESKKNEILDPDMNNVVSSIDSENLFDAVEEAYLFLSNEREKDHKAVFKALQEDYLERKYFKERGTKIVFEADEPANNVGNQQANGQQGTAPVVNNNTNNNQNGDNKNDLKPKVIDNNTENNNNNQNGDNKNGGSFISKIVSWWQEMVQKFLNNNKAEAAQYKSFMDTKKNRDELTGRSYSNVSIQCLPYKNMPIETIYREIDGFTNVVASFANNKQALDSLKSNNDILQKILPNLKIIMTDKDSEDIISDKIKNYFKVGQKPLQLVTISNNELENEVKNVMIPFCDSYFNNIPNELKTKLDKLTQTVSSSLSTKQVQESVNILFEAEGNGEMTYDQKARFISNVAQKFSGSILNSLRERKNDYMTIFKSLVSPAAPANNNNKQGNTGNNPPQQPTENNGQQPEQNNQ